MCGEQHSGATKGMSLAELHKHGRRDERRGNGPPLTRPAAGPGRTPPAAPTTRRGPELAGRSRPPEREPGRTGAGAGALAARRVPPVARHGAGREGEKPGGVRTPAWQGDTVRRVCPQTPAWQGETAAHSHTAGANRPGTVADINSVSPQLRVYGRPYSITTQGGEVVSLWPVVLEGTGIIGYWVKENIPAAGQDQPCDRAIKILADRQCRLDFTYLAAALRSSQ